MAYYGAVASGRRARSVQIARHPGSTEGHTGTIRLLRDLDGLGIRFSDLDTRQSSLEDIFVSVVEQSS